MVEFMKKYILVSVMLFLSISTVVMAQDVSFVASVNKHTISINDRLELTLTVNGAQDMGSPELGDLEGFEVLSSGSSSKFSFVNGVMNASKSFVYTLLPLEEGEITIPSATIDVGGEAYETKPIVVTVTEGRQAQSTQSKTTTSPTSKEQSVSPQEESLSDKIFIEVTVDKEEVFLGQQVVMIFRLYYRDLKFDALQYVPPVTKGFITESLGKQREDREIRNGIVYNIIELKTAIFPASVGELVIEPAKLKCDILLRSRRQGRSHGGFFADPFFDTYTRYPVEMESDPIKLSVMPLPQERKPDMFKGAIGTYDLSVTVDPESLPVGEPINIVMKISGAGNISGLSEPEIEDLNGFKTYNSEIKTNITSREREITGEKIFQNIIIPQNEEIKEIPRIHFSYFDLITRDYKTITKGPFPITVTPRINKDTEIVDIIKESLPAKESKDTITILARDIHYIKTAPGVFIENGGVWFKNIWLWIGIVLGPVLLLVISWVYQSHRLRMREDNVYAKAKGAYRQVQLFIKEAKVYERENDKKQYYSLVAKAIQTYISDRLNVPQGTITSNTVDNILKDKIKSRELRGEIKDILEECDMMRFGAVLDSKIDKIDVLKHVKRIIQQLEKKL